MLPTSVKDEPEMVAASKVMDNLFDGFDDRLKLMLVYSRIDELTERELDDLAWQFNIGYYEGYSLAENIGERRRLIKHAIQAHWYKGTKWGLESIPVFLGMPAFTVEWFESDLLGTVMEPHEFDIAIDTSVRGTSATIHDDVIQLVNNLKNVRSYLRHVILMEAWRVSAYFGAQGQGVKAGKVLPLRWPGGAAQAKYGWATGGYDAILGRVKPKALTDATAWAKYTILTNGQFVAANRVRPKPMGDVKFIMNIIRGAGSQTNSTASTKPKFFIDKTAHIKYYTGAFGNSATAASIRPKPIKKIKTNAQINAKIGHYSASICRVRPLLAA
jgi:P2-related tail formation protein